MRGACDQRPRFGRRESTSVALAQKSDGRSASSGGDVRSISRSLIVRSRSRSALPLDGFAGCLRLVDESEVFLALMPPGLPESPHAHSRAGDSLRELGWRHLNGQLAWLPHKQQCNSLLLGVAIYEIHLEDALGFL